MKIMQNVHNIYFYYTKYEFSCIYIGIHSLLLEKKGTRKRLFRKCREIV